MLPAIVQKLHLLFRHEGIRAIGASASGEVLLCVFIPMAEGDAKLKTRVFDEALELSSPLYPRTSMVPKECAVQRCESAPAQPYGAQQRPARLL